MPLVKRRVTPTRVCNAPVPDGVELVDEREFVTNTSFCSLLQQLAHLTVLADSIFGEVSESIRDLDARSRAVAAKIDRVHEFVFSFDHRSVPIPEGDLVSFSQRKEHFSSKSRLTDEEMAASLGLFNETTRPASLRELYDEAGQTPATVLVPRDVGDDGDRLLCTPVLGSRHHQHGRRPSCLTDDEEALLEIETLKPANFKELPEWVPEEDDEVFLTTVPGTIRVRSSISMSPAPTAAAVAAVPSREPAGAAAATAGSDGVDATAAAGSDSVPPPPSSSPSGSGSDVPLRRASVDRASCRKLPRPEDRVRVLVEHCPPADVVVDVTGRGFDRMTEFRRSLIHFEYFKKKKKKRRKRRNTIAGDEASDAADKKDSGRSKSQKAREKEKGVKSRRQIKSSGDEVDGSLLNQSHEVTSECSDPIAAAANAGPDDDDVVVAAVPRRGSTRALVHSPDSAAASSSAAAPTVPAVARVKAAGDVDDAARSSSGHWTGSGGSADSCSSAHTSVESESPRKVWGGAVSPPALLKAAAAGAGTSGAGAGLGDDIPFMDDEESSSVYSCDTEGYYTSFHVDTGISKPQHLGARWQQYHQQLLEKERMDQEQAVSPRTRTDGEYEVFGKGSSSTTNTSDSALTVVAATNLATSGASGSSSAGAVFRPTSTGGPKKVPPPPPKRTCSLERNLSNRSAGTTRSNRDSVVTVIDVSVDAPSFDGSAGPDALPHPSPGAGVGDASAPTPTSEAAAGGAAVNDESSIECGHDVSEFSDFDAPDRVDEFKSKTTITAGRIPSLCAITPTPPNSDDENRLNQSTTPVPSPSPPAPTETEVPAAGTTSRLGDGSIPDLVPQNDAAANIKPSSPHHHLHHRHVLPEDNVFRVPDIKQPLLPDPRRFSFNGDGVDGGILRTSSPAPGVVVPSGRGEDGGRGGTSSPFAAPPPPPPLPIIRARASPSNSLERRRIRPGARVTLGVDGEVIYSSGSLTRRKSKPPADGNDDGDCTASVAFREELPKTTAVTGTSGVLAVSGKPGQNQTQPQAASKDDGLPPDLITSEKNDGGRASSVLQMRASFPSSVSSTHLGVRRNESYKLAAQVSSPASDSSSSSATAGSVDQQQLDSSGGSSSSGSKSVFRIEPLKATNIKPMPLFKGDIRDRSSRLASAARITAFPASSNPARPILPHQDLSKGAGAPAVASLSSSFKTPPSYPGGNRHPAGSAVPIPVVVAAGAASSPKPDDGRGKSNKPTAAAALKSGGYVVRSLVKSPTPVEYKQLAEAHISRSSLLPSTSAPPSPSPSPSPAAAGNNVFSFRRPSDPTTTASSIEGDLSRAQFRSLPLAVGFPTALCPTTTTTASAAGVVGRRPSSFNPQPPPSSLLAQARQQNQLLRQKLNLDRQKNVADQPSTTAENSNNISDNNNPFRPTQPPRLFTDADYGFNSSANSSSNSSNSSSSSSGSSTMSPGSPKSFGNDESLMSTSAGSTFISSPLQASTPTRAAPAGGGRQVPTSTKPPVSNLEELYRFTNTQQLQQKQLRQQQQRAVGGGGDASSSNTSPSSTRSSSPCSLGSTGSFDFEFRGVGGAGRRNSWAHPTGTTMTAATLPAGGAAQQQFLRAGGGVPGGGRAAGLPVNGGGPRVNTYPRRMSWAAGTKASIGGGSPGTSLQDFKKLLAKHGPNMNQRVSAVEQLKYKTASCASSQQPIVGDPRNKQRLLSIASRMGLRSASKFRPPKTDVLSCTIPEDEFETSPSSPSKVQQHNLTPKTDGNMDDGRNKQEDVLNNNSRDVDGDSKCDSVTLRNDDDGDDALESSLEDDLGGVPAVSSNSGSDSGLSPASSDAGDANGNPRPAAADVTADGDADVDVALETHL